MADRITTLQAMIAKSPGDVFLHYSLGMEYAAGGQFDAAVTEFRQAIAIDATYVPAYVEAGKSLRSAGRLGEAREIFAAGL
ncbi:MAG: tetratricopeptide repeat protein, partial [Planctomycetaceae bacterium]